MAVNVISPLNDVCMLVVQSPAAGKKGKASPAKAKGAPPAEAPPTETRAPVETPEQLAQRQRKVHLYKEFKAAIEKEGLIYNSTRVPVG